MNSRAIKRGETRKFTSEARPIMDWIVANTVTICRFEGATGSTVITGSARPVDEGMLSTTGETRGEIHLQKNKN